ncbi:T9SS type A sorting domain-containing protein [Flavobacteriaceae bacterium TK19130]|nr:T9SS type A sorting domain-containing protein [Thermobacterium salinum]
MKLLVTVLLSFTSVIGFAQELPEELYDTWYLNFFQSTDLSTPYTIADFEPTINPYLIIDENLTMQGEGACNTFSGDYEYLFENTFVFSNLNFTNTEDNCEVTQQNIFENSFLIFLQNDFWYQFEEDSQGYRLGFYSSIFGIAEFTNYELDENEYSRDGFLLFPNPTEDMLYLRTDGAQVDSVSVYDVFAQKIFTANHVEEIDVSNLAVGIYMVEIIVDGNKSTKKILKQ